MQRIVVVLPAPFGPRKPVTLPGSMPNVRLSTAILAPYRFVRPRTSIMGNRSSLKLRRFQFWPAADRRRVTPGDDLPGTPTGLLRRLQLDAERRPIVTYRA